MELSIRRGRRRRRRRRRRCRRGSRYSRSHCRSRSDVVSQEFLVNDVDGIIHTVYYIINFFYTVYQISRS